MIATTPCGRSHAAPKPRPRAHTNRQLAMLRATSDTHIAALANNLQDAVPVGLAILSKELLTLLLWRELGPCRRSLQWHKQANKKVSVVRGGCKALATSCSLARMDTIVRVWPQAATVSPVPRQLPACCGWLAASRPGVAAAATRLGRWQTPALVAPERCWRLGPVRTRSQLVLLPLRCWAHVVQCCEQRRSEPVPRASPSRPWTRPAGPGP